MTLREQIGSLLTIGISGFSLNQRERDFLIDNNIGGVILFKRNFESPLQLLELSQELKRVGERSASGLPILVSVDQEGGRVQRFRKPFTEWPPMNSLGTLGSATVAFNLAHKLGLELSAVGIHVNFAPSVDILTNPRNTVIGDRALSSDPEKVATLGSALVRGFLKAGITPVAKHFPGHGHTLIDSHEDLPKEQRTEAELWACELKPFQKVIRSKVPAIMTSHILFESIDPQFPASLSPVLTEKLLKQDLKFRGVVYTDDLDMGALRKYWPQAEIPVRALNSGADLLLYCNDPESPVIAMDSLEQAIHNGLVSRERFESALSRSLEFRKAALARSIGIGVGSSADLSALAGVGCAEYIELANAIRNGHVPSGLLREANS